MTIVRADEVKDDSGNTIIYQVVRLDETALEAIRLIVREEIARAQRDA